MAKQTDKRQSSRRDKNPAEAASARQTLGDTRTGTSPASLKQAVLDNLCYVQGRLPELATKNDWYMAVAYTVRDRMLERFITALQGLSRPEVKIASYLSAEFLMGPHLGNDLLNLGITGQMREALKELGLELDELLNQEEEPGLGNGGLGRLAACYMDSLASLNVPAIGYDQVRVRHLRSGDPAAHSFSARRGTRARTPAGRPHHPRGASDTARQEDGEGPEEEQR